MYFLLRTWEQRCFFETDLHGTQEMLSSILFETLASDLTKIGQYIWKVRIGIDLPSKEIMGSNASNFMKCTTKWFVFVHTL